MSNQVCPVLNTYISDDNRFVVSTNSSYHCGNAQYGDKCVFFVLSNPPLPNINKNYNVIVNKDYVNNTFYTDQLSPGTYTFTVISLILDDDNDDENIDISIMDAGDDYLECGKYTVTIGNKSIMYSPLLTIILGLIYGIMILSTIILILRNKTIKCPTC